MGKLRHSPRNCQPSANLVPVSPLLLLSLLTVLKENISFLSYDVCAVFLISVSAQLSSEAGRGLGFPEASVTGGCERLSVGAGS